MAERRRENITGHLEERAELVCRCDDLFDEAFFGVGNLASLDIDRETYDYIGLRDHTGDFAYIFRNNLGNASAATYPYWVQEEMVAFEQNSGEPRDFSIDYPIDRFGNIYMKLEHKGETVFADAPKAIKERVGRLLYRGKIQEIITD